MAQLEGPMQLIELEAFTALGKLDANQIPEARRRFMTLLAPSSAAMRKGGSGRILQVFNSFGQPFALKSLLVNRDIDDEEQVRHLYSGLSRAFEEEYRAHALVSGIPGFPRLHGRGRYAGGPVILMEWVEGKTLMSTTPLLPAWQGTKRDGRVVAALGAAVAATLLRARLARPGFAHRDISPRNIMLRTSGIPLERQIESLTFDAHLVDMGSSSMTAMGLTSITMVGLYRNGTPEYAPPEMLSSDMDDIDVLRKSPSIDSYALCSVLYELYAGHTPYRVLFNQVEKGLNPYKMKLGYAPIPLEAHVDEDESLVRLILAGIHPDQAARIGLDELFDGLNGYLGRRVRACDLKLPNIMLPEGETEL